MLWSRRVALPCLIILTLITVLVATTLEDRLYGNSTSIADGIDPYCLGRWLDSLRDQSGDDPVEGSVELDQPSLSGATRAGDGMTPIANLRRCPVEEGYHVGAIETESAPDGAAKVEVTLFSNDSGRYEAVGYEAYSARTLGPSSAPTLVLERFWNGGGSGHFSEIHVVRREGAALKWLGSVGGGDRCNGGLEVTGADSKGFEYSVNLTPFTFVEIDDNRDHRVIRLLHSLAGHDDPYKRLAPYDDLNNSAASCVGREVVRFEVDTGEERTLRVEVDRKSLLPIDVGNAYGRYQSCFNRFFYEQFSGEANTILMLSPERHRVFVSRFYEVCVPAPK